MIKDQFTLEIIPQHVAREWNITEVKKKKSLFTKTIRLGKFKFFFVISRKA